MRLKTDSCLTPLSHGSTRWLTLTLVRLLSLAPLSLQVVPRRRLRLAHPRLALALVDRLQAVHAVRVVHVEGALLGGAGGAR